MRGTCQTPNRPQTELRIKPGMMELWGADTNLSATLCHNDCKIILISLLFILMIPLSGALSSSIMFPFLAFKNSCGKRSEVYVKNTKSCYFVIYT